jgi:hypothetical protein
VHDIINEFILLMINESFSKTKNRIMRQICLSISICFIIAFKTVVQIPKISAGSGIRSPVIKTGSLFLCAIIKYKAVGRFDAFAIICMNESATVNQTLSHTQLYNQRCGTGGRSADIGIQSGLFLLLCVN